MHPKVKAASTAGAASIVLCWLFAQFGIDVPGDVAAAFTTLASFAAGWLRGAS